MSHVIIRRLHGVEELQDARFICDAVWPSVVTGTEITQNLLTAMEHSGGYVSAAYMSDAPSKPVGAVVSFLGRHKHEGHWNTHLHSHMAAVLPQYRDHNIGTLLKRDQRDWAIEHDINVISWTFDPLVRRNARLNIIKLGVDIREYLVNFYGDMNDELNTGDESDRLMAWWNITSPKVEMAMRGELTHLHHLPPHAVVVPLPEDIVEVRTHDPQAAHQWRVTVRESILEALSQGLTLVGLDKHDSYVFAPVGDK